MFRIEIAGNDVNFAVGTDQSEVVTGAPELGMKQKMGVQNRGAAVAWRLRSQNLMGPGVRTAPIVVPVVQDLPFWPQGRAARSKNTC
jgi:hypothetical protein